MDDFISKEEVLETIRYRVCQGHGNKEHICKRGSCAYCGIMEIMNDISSIEAADVQPVKHGRWIDNGICDSMLSACSICGYSCGAYSFNYCPNCGSKNRMDGDSDGQ